MSAFTDYLAHRRALAEARMRHRRLMEAAQTYRELALALRWKSAHWAMDRRHDDAKWALERSPALIERSAEILREAKEDLP